MSLRAIKQSHSHKRLFVKFNAKIQKICEWIKSKCQSLPKTCARRSHFYLFSVRKTSRFVAQSFFHSIKIASSSNQERKMPEIFWTVTVALNYWAIVAFRCFITVNWLNVLWNEKLGCLNVVIKLEKKEKV